MPKIQTDLSKLFPQHEGGGPKMVPQNEQEPQLIAVLHNEHIY
jgi:hypothetical protein